MSTDAASWIDVRTQEENQTRNYPGDLCIPYELISQIAGQDISKDQKIYLYCRTGRRSGIAQQDLINLGYTDVHNAGGFEEMLALRAKD